MEQASCFEKKATVYQSKRRHIPKRTFCSKLKYIFSISNTSSGSGAHPNYYRMDTGGPFFGVKAAEA
jgi:hypothetical protein